MNQIARKLTASTLAVARDPLLQPLSLAVSFATFAWLWDYWSATVVCAVFALHELGHAIAMWQCGYRHIRIHFVPFLGAVTTGRAPALSSRQQLAVCLAGPLPGLCLAAAIVLLAPHATHHGPGRSIVLGLAIINGINLLPFYPLDGGRIIELLYASSRRRQTALHWSGAAGLVGLAFALHDLAMGIVGVAVAASLIRWKRAPTQPSRPS